MCVQNESSFTLKHCFQIGDLLYCRNRGRTTCCFQNETCGKDMNEVLLKQIKRYVHY